MEAKLDDFIPRARFKNWVVKFQQRPANILIRPNMATSIWQCLAALVMMVMMREAYVFDREGAGIAAGEFVRILIELGRMTSRMPPPSDGWWSSTTQCLFHSR